MKMMRMMCAIALLLPTTVLGQSTFDTGIPYDNKVTGVVPLQCDGTGKNCQALGPANPLHATVQPSQTAATSTPLTGSSATTQTVGPFAPQLGRPINLTLAGTWTGSAQLLRSIDGGTTKTPLTVGGTSWANYSANANEPAWIETESGASYYLALTLSAGTLTYRVSQ